jgi:hypothetical protein
MPVWQRFHRLAPDRRTPPPCIQIRGTGHGSSRRIQPGDSHKRSTPGAAGDMLVVAALRVCSAKAQETAWAVSLLSQHIDEMT